MTVGEKIKMRRIELNMTQDELAKKCGYKSRTSINKIELQRDIPLKKLKVFAEALDLDIAYLAGWIELGEYYAEQQEFSKDFCLIKNEDMKVLESIAGDKAKFNELMRYAMFLLSQDK